MNKQELIHRLNFQQYTSPCNDFQRGYNGGLQDLSSWLKNSKQQKPFTSSTPTHYQGTIQPIDLINAQDLNFNLGNVVKYVCRAGKKQGENILSDLEKAKDYINFEIERVKQWTNVKEKN